MLHIYQVEEQELAICSGRRSINKNTTIKIKRGCIAKKKKDKICIKIYLKADVLGTLEALVSEINKITHQEAEIKIIKQGLGDFTESEVLDAEAENAVLIGFKVKAVAKAEQLINGRNTSILRTLNELWATAI